MNHILLDKQDDDGVWTEARNKRRCHLIDKDIDGTLAPAEAVELKMLQRAMLEYRNKVAPLPIAAVRKFHEDLLAMMSGIESQQQLENTKEKPRNLEDHYRKRKEESADNSHARKLSLQSVKRTINQLKEEIARFEAHSHTKN